LPTAFQCNILKTLNPSGNLSCKIVLGEQSCLLLVNKQTEYLIFLICAVKKSMHANKNQKSNWRLVHSANWCELRISDTQGWQKAWWVNWSAQLLA